MSSPSPLQRLPLLGRFELHRFKGRLPRLALVFVLLVPLLYGAIYLAANWDPYGRLDRLPVAVVNLDTGTTYDKKQVHAGDDFVESLHTQHNFDYRDVSAAEADRGLREGDYYLAITVPADFSADLVSGQGDDPQRAGILLRRNDANGFVIGSITNSAQNAIARSVDESATASYFDAVFANLEDHPQRSRGRDGRGRQAARRHRLGRRRVRSGRGRREHGRDGRGRPARGRPAAGDRARHREGGLGRAGHRDRPPAHRGRAAVRRRRPGGRRDPAAERQGPARARGRRP